MYIIVEVVGCLPYVNVVQSEDCEGAMIFESKRDAKHFAEENCAWDYKVVEV
jgi:hypothetical protein